MHTELHRAPDSASQYSERNGPLATSVLTKTGAKKAPSKAATKASSMPREVFKETWAYFQAMLRLIRAYYRGDYRQVPMPTLLLIIATIIYIVNPLDLIPDWIPGLGFLDDAFILAFAVHRTRQSLDDFMAWETASSERRVFK